MPKREDISSVLIIGAGPIVIGQACEFDYSGTQACKVLKEEGYRVVLINSNPATIMTDPNLSDATYIEPITVEVLEKILIKENIDAILPTVGGQVALNCAMDLFHQGILKKYKVELIGASPDAIEKAENRSLFNVAMNKIGLSCPKNIIVSSVDEIQEILGYISLPAIIRPSFTLGGSGGGVAYNKEEFFSMVSSALDASPTSEVQIDESVIGWKEYEMEVVRDKKDNCIIVCSIENIDPMGVHTGDSITVAPALTLTDKEYQSMRNASLAVVREIGVDTGGANVQFAVNPKDGRLLVIEMNPRVSRSSALASKATGFPIAKVAAKLAIGYTLDEILNDCTGVTPASFEPVIDYVVTKIPRFNFEKFTESEVSLTTSMKSVGEVMAIGRSFAESLQKALRSMETGISGLDGIFPAGSDKEFVRKALHKVVPERILHIAESFRYGFSVEEVSEITCCDPWFLSQIKNIVDIEEKIRLKGLPDNKADFLSIKKSGFSDERLAQIVGTDTGKVKEIRQKLGVFPVFKRIDTCSSEFSSSTKYMYSCYEGDSFSLADCEAEISDREKIIIIGSGPNRIGQGIEFDCCCVHAVNHLKDEGYETIMINCNPETVSTDYDLADRLYFEPLTEENIYDIASKEQEKGSLKGVIVQYGGQTPIKLAKALQDSGIPILGTSPEAIDIAEDRELFKNMVKKLGFQQPANSIAASVEELKEKVLEIGYPVVVRPSFVLGGSKMKIIQDNESLKNYIDNISIDFRRGPVLIDKFLEGAKEVDIDVICDQKEVFVAGIMEHIEEAGIHSGDSACSIPPYSLDSEMVDIIKTQAKALALELKVKGLMNAQFAVKGRELYIIEVNPRASRTVPFVSKVINLQVAGIASVVMAGKLLSDFALKDFSCDMKYIAVKEAVFPFARFPGVDIILGPEMKSTGEVMGIDYSFKEAFAKSQIAAGNNIPSKGTVFISVKSSDKNEVLESLASSCIKFGFSVIATSGTAKYLKEKGLSVDIINKVLEGKPHIVDYIKEGKVDLVINTTEGIKSISDSFSIREAALLNKISYSTTIEGAKAILSSIGILKEKGSLGVYSMQSYFNS